MALTQLKQSIGSMRVKPGNAKLKFSKKKEKELKATITSLGGQKL